MGEIDCFLELLGCLKHLNAYTQILVTSDTYNHEDEMTFYQVKKMIIENLKYISRLADIKVNEKRS